MDRRTCRWKWYLPEPRYDARKQAIDWHISYVESRRRGAVTTCPSGHEAGTHSGKTQTLFLTLTSSGWVAKAYESELYQMLIDVFLKLEAAVPQVLLTQPRTWAQAMFPDTGTEPSTRRGRYRSSLHRPYLRICPYDSRYPAPFRVESGLWTRWARRSGSRIDLLWHLRRHPAGERRCRGRLPPRRRH